MLAFEFVVVGTPVSQQTRNRARLRAWKSQVRIEAVAREYRKKGYDVTIEPSSHELPSFLQGFRPDIIARGENEIVIIEVKTQSTLSESR
ncbi:MAG: hypothetical protein ACETWT_07405 [Thermodesulfobacteriota bacterium]